VNALCQMTGLNRAGFYCWRTPGQAMPVEMELRDQMQKVALESPAYGYRRITSALRKRGFVVNRKRVLRMMREDNLLCVRRRSFVVTTDSCHTLPIYPNLAPKIKPTAINQLWVADITYIRLRTEFVYLAVVLDAFSRRVIGWALGRTLEAELTVTALRMALIERQPAPGLVHHSDRGVQYASQDLSGQSLPIIRRELVCGFPTESWSADSKGDRGGVAEGRLAETVGTFPLHAERRAGSQ
jgi:putative transposase